MKHELSKFVPPEMLSHQVREGNNAALEKIEDDSEEEEDHVRATASFTGFTFPEDLQH